MATQYHVKKGDTVEVRTGRERGKKGKIIKIDTGKGRVTIEKLMMIKRHTKPSQTNTSGGIIEKEGTINIVNVLLVCPKCGKGVRTGAKILEDGRKIRACVKCGEALDK
jgi:large subunit ribosomal protein L24